MGTKVKDFLAALESGETKEEAIKVSGVSPATANIQHAQWKKGNKSGQVPKTGKVKGEKVEVKEETPKSPIPGIPLPKKGK